VRIDSTIAPIAWLVRPGWSFFVLEFSRKLNPFQLEWLLS